MSILALDYSFLGQNRQTMGCLNLSTLQNEPFMQDFDI